MSLARHVRKKQSSTSLKMTVSVWSVVPFKKWLKIPILQSNQTWRNCICFCFCFLLFSFLLFAICFFAFCFLAAFLLFLLLLKTHTCGPSVLAPSPRGSIAQLLVRFIKIKTLSSEEVTWYMTLKYGLPSNPTSVEVCKSAFETNPSQGWVAN